MPRKDIFKRVVIKIALISAVFVFVLTGELSATTSIHVNSSECVITIFLRKEFHQVSLQGITDWINQVNNEIAKAQAVLNRGWLGNLLKSSATVALERQAAQNKLNWFNPLLTRLQDILSNYNPLTQAQLQALVDNWKQEIEQKWNVPNYRLDCCEVKVKVAAILREETDPPHVRGGNDPENDSFDQIAIIPGSFRSYIDGFDTPFDANGFSDAPYNHEMTGAWRANTTAGYTAPHEAGHEMGLVDRYTGPNADLNHEKDIMDGAGTLTLAQFAALSAVTVSNGVSVDNLATILNARNIQCPKPPCCPVPPGVVIGTTLIPGSRVHEDVVGHSERTPGQAAEPQSRLPDAEKPPAPQQPQSDTSSSRLPEGIQHKDALVDGEVKVDTGIHYQDTPGGGMKVDTTSLATGRKGPDFRKWEVTDTTILIDGQKVKPVKKDKFYMPKESAMRNVAVAVFVAIGAQYGDYAKGAESGQVCPVTGKPISEGMKKSGMDRAIDKAGMAAGLGLLASQAKGEITGQKCSFNLDKQQAQKLKEGKAALKVRAEHTETRAIKNTEMPLGKVSF